jgi:hypothetical protein
MDKSLVFADNLDNVQGLLPYDGGLIATTRTQILFLKDTDGDGKADVNRPLIKGFNPRHSQLQVSAPRWGPDGCVHFNNGLDAKEIYPADAPDKVVGVPGPTSNGTPRPAPSRPPVAKANTAALSMTTAITSIARTAIRSCSPSCPGTPCSATRMPASPRCMRTSPRPEPTHASSRSRSRTPRQTPTPAQTPLVPAWASIVAT